MSERKFDDFEIQIQYMQKELFRVEKFEMILSKKATKQELDLLDQDIVAKFCTKKHHEEFVEEFNTL
jgi:hypothetical protein